MFQERLKYFLNCWAVLIRHFFLKSSVTFYYKDLMSEMVQKDFSSQGKMLKQRFMTAVQETICENL